MIKVCTKCEIEKSIYEFRKRKHKTKIGRSPYCNKCENEYTAAWRQKKRESGELKDLESTYNRRYYEKNGKRVRTLKREQAIRERRRKGMKPNVRSAHRVPQLKSKPFLDYLEREVDSYGVNIVAGRMGILPDRVRTLLKREQKVIPETTVDLYLMEYGEPWMLYRLYPELEDYVPA